jgi:hypothetical protein
MSDRRVLPRLLAVVGFCMLGSCASPPSEMASAESQEDSARIWDAPESLLVAESPIAPALDIAVELFDPGISDDDRSPLAAVRRMESQLLAGELRETLVRSNQWGVVRLVPTASALTPVSIRAAIVASDGRDLVLDVVVKDAMGILWFDHTVAYRQQSAGDDGLTGIFNALANRLLSVWQGKDRDERYASLHGADIAYAEALAPAAFSGMIQRSETDWEVIRLPAEDDPMLARIERIRNQEYLFCDTIDEQYVDMVDRVGPTYRLWRAATLEQTEWLERYQKRAAARTGSAGDSEFTRMQAEYAAYRSFRIQEQALFELAEAFDGEARPTVIRTQDQVFRLEGTLDTQYDTWRALLRDIYLIETGGQAL